MDTEIKCAVNLCCWTQFRRALSITTRGLHLIAVTAKKRAIITLLVAIVGTSQVQAIITLMGYGSEVHCQTLLNDISDSIKPSLLFSYIVGIQYF